MTGLRLLGLVCSSKNMQFSARKSAAGVVLLDVVAEDDNMDGVGGGTMVAVGEGTCFGGGGGG